MPYSYPAQQGGDGGNGGNAGDGGNGKAGGIYGGKGASLSIQSSTISGNTASAGAAGATGAGGVAGAGVYDYMGTVMRGANGPSGSAGAAGTAEGGGVLSTYGSLAILQATIATNHAAKGAGVAIEQDTSASLSNSTIALNAATSAGGGVFINLDSAKDAVSIISTIVALNTVSVSTGGADVNGTFTANHDLLFSMVDAVFTDSNTIVGKNPLLGALGLHGGTTAVMLPKHGSPAIDHGVDPTGLLTTDQRGAGFPIKDKFGDIDIGAVTLPTG
jgi:hypothetical protein